MNSQVIFFKLNTKDDWRFSGFVEWGTFDVATFRAENPNGNVLLVDLDMLAGDRSVISQDLTLDDRIVMTTVPLNDGRVVNVFPSDGGIQVYDAPHVRGYQLKLPQVEKVAQYSFLIKKQTGSDGCPVGAKMIEQ